MPDSHTMSWTDPLVAHSLPRQNWVASRSCRRRVGAVDGHGLKKKLLAKSLSKTAASEVFHVFFRGKGPTSRSHSHFSTGTLCIAEEGPIQAQLNNAFLNTDSSDTHRENFCTQRQQSKKTSVVDTSRRWCRCRSRQGEKGSNQAKNRRRDAR